MITGDHPRTAARIARDLGIAEKATVAVSGVVLDQLDDQQFSDTVREHSVYARVTPTTSCASSTPSRTTARSWQ